jgi:hypothetical protein
MNARSKFFASFCASAVLTACSNGSVPSAPSNGAPLASLTVDAKTQPQKLYVPDDSTKGSLLVYSLPLTAASKPIVTRRFDQSFLVASDSKYVAVTTLNDTMRIFAQPLKRSGRPIAKFKVVNEGQFFWHRGRLFVANGASIAVYGPPFTNATKPKHSIALHGVQAQEMARDATGIIYINSDGSAIEALKDFNVVATVTAESNVQYRGMAASAKHLCVSGFSSSGRNAVYLVDIYDLPIATGATPAARITNGLTGSEACSFDARGNLYVAQPSGVITMYSLPLTSASEPAITLHDHGDAFGMWIGR